jgi:hypothetical protein
MLFAYSIYNPKDAVIPKNNLAARVAKRGCDIYFLHRLVSPAKQKFVHNPANLIEQAKSPCNKNLP